VKRERQPLAIILENEKTTTNFNIRPHYFVCIPATKDYAFALETI
jgi:hypothetical protein